MSKIIRILLMLGVFIFIDSTLINCNRVYADDDYYDDYNYDSYDYSEIDNILKGIEGNDTVTFKELVKLILEGDFYELNLKNISKLILNELRSNYTSVIKIIMLGILSALLNAMLPVFNQKQLSDIANMIVMITLVTVLATSFYMANSICFTALTNCIDIYKAILPVFLSAITVVTGSLTTGMYYEIMLAAITVVTSVFRDGLLLSIKVWFVLVIADSINVKKRFSKACKLIRWLVKTVCKVVFTLFAGISGVKGMVIPYTEGYKKKTLYKTVKILPGVGDAAEVVSDTVIGASVAIKNSIGVAGIIILLIINAVPVFKLVILMLIFKVLAASLEPVLDGGFVSVIDSLGDIIGTFIYVLVSGLSLFIIMAGIICAMTNVT